MLPSAQTTLGRVLRLPLRLIPRTAVVPILTGVNRGLRWQVGSGTHGCWLGTYEAAKQEILRQAVRKGMNAVDAGANCGFYTLALARLVGEQGRVWAFEPMPRFALQTRLHLERNKFVNATVRELALSERAGSARFRFFEEYSTMGTLDQAGELLVRTDTLDGLVREGMPAPDIVKIDVEGGELGVLKGASELVARGRTVWLVALDAPANRDACLALLKGYRIQEFCPGEIVAWPRA